MRLRAPLLLPLATLAPLATATVVAAAGGGGDVPIPVVGGPKVQAAYKKWLEVWRSKYAPSNGTVPELPDATLPQAMREASPKVILSEGGAAGGVVTEGMGYALMVEGFQAADGDPAGLQNGLAFARSWLGMVRGTGDALTGGGDGTLASATEVDTYPYGVSAIESLQAGLAGSGVATWKYPVGLCEGGCRGSAADGDADAIMGMIYLCAALKYPADFVDVVLRAVISFASADLGFPDLYRVLPDGSKMFVPKGGSDWGSELPTQGRYKSSQHSWCYSPGYFAPAQYRLMRAFAVNNWKPEFNQYLPPSVSGQKTTLDDLTQAFDGAVTAGYNILFYSSCISGAASNWVGVKAECADEAALSCEGVPWATTPYVGAAGECTASGTSFGAYGAEASRTPWRIALDFAIYPEWATKVQIYDRAGRVDSSIVFNAQTYLNRIADQYRRLATPVADPVKLCPAFDVSHGATDLTCEGVPYNGTANWWGALMSYPTFVGFVAPSSASPASPQGPIEAQKWMDSLVGLCDINLMTGMFCDTSYFGSSMEVIATMILAGAVHKGGPPPPAAPPAAAAATPPAAADTAAVQPAAEMAGAAVAAAIAAPPVVRGVITDAEVEPAGAEGGAAALRQQRRERDARDSYQALLFPLLGLSAALAVPLATAAAARARPAAAAAAAARQAAYATLLEPSVDIRADAAAAPA